MCFLCVMSIQRGSLGSCKGKPLARGSNVAMNSGISSLPKKKISRRVSNVREKRTPSHWYHTYVEVSEKRGALAQIVEFRRMHK